MHIHTKYSCDSIMPFCLLYLKCCYLKINYIAITEHNNIKGALKFQDYCRKHGNRINVIIGEEIMTADGEIIGLFLKNEIRAGLSLSETIDEILSQKAIVCVPHPYDLKRIKTVLNEKAIEENKNKINCMEIHNGRNIMIEYSEKQKELSEKYCLTPVIGSDAHTIFEIGRNYMEVSICPDTPEKFLEAIKSAKYMRKDCLRYSHILTKFVRIVKYVERGDFCGLYRTVIKKIRNRK